MDARIAYSLRALERRYGVGRDRWSAAVRSGELIAHRIGLRRFIVLERDVEAWRARYRVPPSSPAGPGERRQLLLPPADNYFFLFLTSPSFGWVFGSFFLLLFRFVESTGSSGRGNERSPATARAFSLRRWAASVR